MGKKAHNIQKEDIETYNGLLVEDPLVKGGGAMNPVGEASKTKFQAFHRRRFKLLS